MRAIISSGQAIDAGVATVERGRVTETTLTVVWDSTKITAGHLTKPTIEIWHDGHLLTVEHRNPAWFELLPGPYEVVVREGSVVQARQEFTASATNDTELNLAIVPNPAPRAVQ